MGETAITLRMADGSVRTVSDRRLLAMIDELGQETVADDTRAVLESISDNGQEQGQGRLCELIKVLAYAHDQVAKETAGYVEGTIQ